VYAFDLYKIVSKAKETSCYSDGSDSFGGVITEKLIRDLSK